MRALYLILPILGILAIAYRYYSAFIAAKVMVLDDRRPTPAHTRPDRHNYHATARWVLFGHHFAAIAGAGPLIGPVLAAQFGYAPGLIWLVGGVCLAGAVHDMIVLWASTRRVGASLADIARSEIGPVAGTTAAIAILFIIIIALAGLGLAVVNALEHSAWGTFTIGTSIPLALFVGWYMYRLRPGRVAEATILGVAGLLACVVLGKPLAASSFGHYFVFTRTQLILLMGGYGFIASVLPVWLLLAPRDYLSSFMKIGTIVSIIAASAMHPGDYFAINTPPAVFETLGMAVTNLPALEAAVQESVTGRTGGAVSLAIGMAQIFAGLPGMRHLLDYWYHFAIMFEALFILTTIDAGTRVARFLVGEFLGRGYAPFARHDWIPGAMISTALVVSSWAYFIWAGSISTIWPMFGIANQLLASVALAVATTVIINAGRARYAWVTILPLSFVSITTLTAGALSVRDNFYPMAIGADAAKHFQGYLNSIVTVLMMICVVVILASAVMRWFAVLNGRLKPLESAG